MRCVVLNRISRSARPAWFLCALWMLLLLPGLPGSGACQAGAKPAFELREGDRVALVGDTLIEREQVHGYLEERLTAQFPRRNIIFRNLGWSADTPAGISRAEFDFDKPGKGFEKLKEQIAAVRPTVIILGYGMASSLGERQGTGGGTPAPREAPERASTEQSVTSARQFKADLERLMDAIQSLSSNGPVRFVILSPIRHEDLGAPLPEPTKHNERLALHVAALRDLATERNCAFVSLFDLAEDEIKGRRVGDGHALPSRPLTENGIHLSAFGYSRAAEKIEKELGWEENWWDLAISTEGKVSSRHGAEITEVTGAKERVQFTALAQRLVSPVLAEREGRRFPTTTTPCRIRIEGLKRGRYELKVDGAAVVTATQSEWRRGVAVERGPELEQAEALRGAIRKKNELYFNRWRPQNDTYLFGFRKQEQGRNAKEIPMFDPLIDEQEAQIARLRQPVKHKFEIVRVENGKGPLTPALSPSDGEREKHQRSAKGERNLPASAATTGEQQAPLFEVAPGFEVNLFAENPLLAKPIQMNFDPQGRLWIASSSVYPQIQPGQVADDKILVLEDTNGDGYAEKSTVFADGLLIPTGVVPGDGGVYVGQSTELLHFKDTNGDGKADEKRIVLSSFGTEDTHHMVHTLRWGEDGQLYFNQSIYIHTHIETPHGVERLNSGGVWHLRPPTMELGVFLRGFCNPWGHQTDEFGQSFETDGAGFQGLSFGLPGATYFTYANMRRELKSISAGSYPKFCGLEIIRSAHFPPEWQGNAITCDFRAHRIARFAIEELGSGYVARELDDLLRSTNVAFRPIDVKLGPDGALYIADWSNPIIQHGEVDFRDPRRDHEHGRIWRVTAKGRPLVPRPRLVNAANKDLLNELLSPNSYNQQQARRVLTERGPKIQTDLARWTQSQTSDAARLQALWMYQSIDVIEPSLLEKVLNAKDGRIRAAATRVAGLWHPRLKQPLDLLARRIADEHPRVRLEAMRALARIPSARSAELVLSALDQPLDDFLDYGAWLSINELAEPWLNAVKSGAWKPEGREKQLEFALKALEPASAGAVLSQLVRGRDLARNGSGPWIDLIGTAGDPALLSGLWEQILRGGFDDSTTAHALEALDVAARKRQARPSAALEELSSVLNHPNEKVRQPALRLAGTWKLKKLTPQLMAAAGGKSNPAALRQSAFDALREIGGRQVIADLEPLTAKGNDSQVRRQAVLSLAALDLDKASQPAADILLETTNEAEATELWRSVLSIKGAGPILARALPKTGLPVAMAKAGLRVAREGGRNEPDLVWALTRGADLEGEAQSLTAEEIQALAGTVVREGDPARGESVYRRKELACATCHAIGGVGGKVGPDLTSIGASAPVDYLIESVLYPNRKIKEGYHSIIIETKDGSEFSGVLAREDNDQLVLRDATDKEISLSKIDIQKRATGNSLMPSGLVDPLSPGERLDLYRFLSELGKPGLFDASKPNVARSWKLYAQTLDVAQFGDERALNTGLSDGKWTPARALVDGRLLKADLAAPLEGLEHSDPQALFAAARFQVAKEGTVRLKRRGTEGAPAWIDGKPLAGDNDLSTDLPAGTHIIVFKLEVKALPAWIRLESPDATFLTD